MHPTRSITNTFLALLAATSVAHAHSWIEQLTVIAPNGTFVGEPGYPRGNVKRTEPGFGDPAMVHLITETPTDPMCKDSQKSPSSQSASSPRLKATPGATVALRYQENGHVTLPQNQLGKPENRGDVFVYGTTKPKDDELFADIHGVWTADGKGGDGRGVLLVKASYDDGQCYQVNGGAISTERQEQFVHTANQLMGADLWCQTDVKLPVDALTGQPYTLYWVWTWETVAGVDPGLPQGKKETYTTCMDVSLDSSSVDSSQKAASGGFIQGQPVENAAVPAQFAKLAEQPATPATGQSASNSSAPAASASATPAPAQSAPAPPGSAAPAPATRGSAPPAPAASNSTAPPLAPPFPAPTVSPGSILTTISPIPGPEASSEPASSAPESDPAATTEETTATVTTTVSTTNTVTPTDSAMVSMSIPLTSVTISSAAPKIRGRNPVFHMGD